MSNVEKKENNEIKLKDIAEAYWNFAKFEIQMKGIGITIDDNKFYENGIDVLYQRLSEAISTGDEDEDYGLKIMEAEDCETFSEFFEKILK